jgi:glycine betaine/proline transport system substrate-binding protein
MNKRHLLGALTLGTAAALTLTACAGGTDGGDGEAAAPKDITIGVFNGWPEGEAVSYIWKSVLEDKGYNVELQYADAGPVFAGVADGAYDIALDGWLPFTHASYFEEFGDDLLDLGSWNDDALLTIAVNADAPVDSLTELAENADLFGNRLIGIEPGAGLTKATQENVIPTYGLEGMEYITSSTPAMLAELSSRIDDGENVAVTLWRPHWAYDAFDIKDLEDPEGTLGAAEEIHTIARMGFDEDFPEVHEWLSNFRMDSDVLFSLENVMYNTDEEISDYTPVVEQWIADNQEWVDGLTS